MLKSLHFQRKHQFNDFQARFALLLRDRAGVNIKRCAAAGMSHQFLCDLDATPSDLRLVAREFLFDNPEDTLSFKDLQTFNFQGRGDAPELLEPLLFYVLHRASNQIANPAKLGSFKMFPTDEAWLFFRNETIRSYIVQAEETWRKHKAAMILATQSLKELQESGLLPVVAECCPTKIFLANPELGRAVYAEVFHLNDTEVELIAGLVPPGQMVIRQVHGSKKVRLIVDPITYWMATNNANDNLKKWKFFEQFGFADGLRRLAEESEGRHRAANVTTPNPTGVLAFYDRPVYAYYLNHPHPFHVSPLDDQILGAVIMWVFGSLVFLVPAILSALDLAGTRVTVANEHYSSANNGKQAS